MPYIIFSDRTFKINRIKKMCLNEKDFITSGNKIKQKISGEKHLDKSPQTKDVDRVRNNKKKIQ